MDVRDIRAHRGEFFRVLQETSRSQTAVMTIAPGADAGPEETHGADQIVYVVEGDIALRVNGEERVASAGTLIMIPAGARHDVRY
jgi:mannose-6-phosphate isomerase-like protein (cupin superfamily)